MCSIMQPTFLPWVGYFDLIDSVEKFVFYDDVQFSKQSWQSRNKINTANGIIWLSVPVKKHLLSANINEIEINNISKWKSKLSKTIYFNYKSTEYFDEVYNIIEPILNKTHNKLSDLSIEIITKISLVIGINTTLYKSSELNAIEGDRELRLIEICKILGGDSYLSTQGSSSYIESSNLGGKFIGSPVSLIYQNYNPEIYCQAFGKFEPYMSIIDVLFNEGLNGTLNIIRKGRGQYLTSEMLRGI
jgi:hypothetical protein